MRRIYFLFLIISSLIPGPSLGAQSDQNPWRLRTEVVADSSATPAQESSEASPGLDRRPEIQPAADRSGLSIWFLPLLLILLALGLRTDLGLGKKLTRSLSNVNYLSLLHREQTGKIHLGMICLFLLFAGAGAYYLRYAIPYWTGGVKLSLIGLIAALILIYVFRTLIMRILYYAFPQTDAIPRYDYTIFIFNQLIGISLLPVCLLIGFGPTALLPLALYLGAAIWIGGMLYRWLRGFILSASIVNRNVFRYFLYLCALEWGPLLLIIGLILRA